MAETNFIYDACVLGGAGHIGLPLGVSIANAGMKTILFDINNEALEKVRDGIFPFKENGGPEALRVALKSGNLVATDVPLSIYNSKFIVIVLGTPIDEYLSPQFGGIMKALDRYLDYFRDGQVVILRSTVYPGSSEKIQSYFIENNKNVRVAFCPERITQGYAIEEIKVLPQIISAFDDKTLKEVADFFGKITQAKLVSVQPIEAETAKLFTNAWRYIRFAAANQFLMIAQNHGLDYRNIERAMKEDYARNKDLPSPGFAAGPCLLKDTMQLAAFTNNSFSLGHAAMLINEGLVNHIIQGLKAEHGESLKIKTLGILGMAFKANSDDYRDSLSYKLRKIAHVECKAVLCTDLHIKDKRFVSLDQLLRNSDIVILAAPHDEYKTIDTASYPNVRFVDVWNFWPALNNAKNISLHARAKKKRVLITGGAGFVGYHLTKHLLNSEENVELVSVDNFMRGRADDDFQELLKDSRIKFIELDLTDQKSYRQLGSNYQHVYHLAAVNGTKAFYEMPHEVLRVNTLSLVYMLEWFYKESKEGKFCFTSSNEIYAGGLSAFHSLPLPTPENVPLVIEDTSNPRWSYASTKLVGELFVTNYSRMHNFRALLVRPHNFYGPRAGYGGHVIPDFSERIAARVDPFPIYYPDHTRTFCYISDAVRAMTMLMDSSKTDGQPIDTVHIGDTEEVTIKDLAQKMFDISGWSPKSLDAKSGPAGDVTRRLADITKLKSLTSWFPEVTLQQGLRNTYEWYAAHPRTS